MSIISVRVNQPANISRVVRAVRPITGESMAAIKAAVERGAPIFQRELFLNDFAEVAESLRQLVRELRLIGASVTIREWDDEITEDVLLNILQGSERYGLGG